MERRRQGSTGGCVAGGCWILGIPAKRQDRESGMVSPLRPRWGRWSVCGARQANIPKVVAGADGERMTDLPAGEVRRVESCNLQQIGRIELAPWELWCGRSEAYDGYVAQVGPTFSGAR